MTSKHVTSLIAPTILVLLTPLSAIASKEDDPAVWIAQGQRDLDRFDFRNAQQSLHRALSLDPKSATAHQLLARALVGQVPPNLHLFADSEGLLAKAEIESKKAVELSPTDAPSWCILGMVEHRLADAAPDERQLQNASTRLTAPSIGR